MNNKRLIEKVLKCLKKEFKKSASSNSVQKTYEDCKLSITRFKEKNKKNTDIITEDELVSLFDELFKKIFLKVRNDCILNSIALQMVLYVYNIPSTLFIGVTRFPFSSHAWIENEKKKILNSYQHRCLNRNIIYKRSL